VYSQINHLFYQSFTSSLSTSSLESSLYYDAMTQTRATGSYFNYNDNPRLVKNYPTGAMEGIRVLSVNQDIYGQQVLPYHFELSSSAYYVKDDGNGNLIDYKNSNVHIGNIFYSHGLATITNQEYQLMFPVPPLAQYKEVTIFDSTDPKIIDLTGQMAARGNTIDYTTLSFFNYDDELFTDDNAGIATITTTAVGTYLTNYKFDAAVPGSNCADNILTSNDGKIKVNVVPNCNFEVSVVELFSTPSPVTPQPVTPQPVTPQPVTPQPVTPQPVTPQPVTPQPVTPNPVTPQPVTPNPVTPNPVTPNPVTPNPVPRAPTVYTYYLTNFLSKTDTDSSGNPDYYDFCFSPGQVTGTQVFSTASTIDLLLNVTLYNENTLTTTFASQGTNGYYAVAATTGLNTFTAGPGAYKLLEVTTGGYVNSVLLQNCSGGGGATPI
jgi:hypothetical protein